MCIAGTIGCPHRQVLLQGHGTSDSVHVSESPRIAGRNAESFVTLKRTGLSNTTIAAKTASASLKGIHVCDQLPSAESWAIRTVHRYGKPLLLRPRRSIARPCMLQPATRRMIATSPVRALCGGPVVPQWGARWRGVYSDRLQVTSSSLTLMQRAVCLM